MTLIVFFSSSRFLHPEAHDFSVFRRRQNVLYSVVLMLLDGSVGRVNCLLNRISFLYFRRLILCVVCQWFSRIVRKYYYHGSNLVQGFPTHSAVFMSL